MRGERYSGIPPAVTPFSENFLYEVVTNVPLGNISIHAVHLRLGFREKRLGFREKHLGTAFRV